MKVSVREFVTLVRRYLIAAGTPSWSVGDATRMVVSAALRDPAALAAMQKIKLEPGYRMPAIVSEGDHEIVLDAHGQSLLLFAGTVVDLCSEKASSHGWAVLRCRNAGDLVFAAGLTERLARRSSNALVALRTAGVTGEPVTAMLLSKAAVAYRLPAFQHLHSDVSAVEATEIVAQASAGTIASDSLTTLGYRSGDAMPCHDAELLVACRPVRNLPPPASGPERGFEWIASRPDDSGMDAIEFEAMRSGIEVDEKLWADLWKTAAEFLVPSSDRSRREAGAGSGHR